MSDKEKKKPTVPQRIIGWFKDAFDWLRETLADDAVRGAVYADIGLKPPEKDEPDPLADLKKKTDDSLGSIERYQKQTDPDQHAFESAVGDIRAVVTAIEAIVRQLKDAGGAAAGEEAAHRLFQLMTVNFLRLRYPWLYWWGQPLGVIEESLTTLGPGEVHWDRIVNVLSAPFEHLKKTGWPPETDEEASVLTDATLVPLAVGIAYWESFLLKAPGLGASLSRLKQKGILSRDIIHGWDAAPGSTTPVADRIAARTLSFAFTAGTDEGPGDTDLEGTITMTMVWVPTSDGGPGLLVALGGGGEVAIPVGGGWNLGLKVDSASAVDFLIWDRVSVNGPSDARASLMLEHPPDPSGLPSVFPRREGTRLEFERIALSGSVGPDGAGFKLEMRKCAFVLRGSDGDGFIEKILPAGETRLAFDLVLGLATGRGFYIEGGTGLQALIPVSRSFGPLTVHHLQVGLLPTPEPKPARIDMEISAAMAVKLGPVVASVDGFGLKARLVFPEAGGADLSFDLKPPTGVGLAINASAVTGGGFLFYDPAKEQYAGIVQLDFKGRFALKAVGLLTTRLPDGTRGFSLLLIISGEDFKPINIGFGFTLNGVGGLLGVNRTVAVDVLRGGLKNGTLDAVLFPEDPVRNAPRIISNLAAAFPAARGQHLIGPMAKIGWGTPTVLTIDLGIILEFPSPTRLVLLGQFRALLPSKDKALIKLQMDALGVVDFDKGEASLDATIYDSRLMQYSMSGDMALRTRWEQDPTFLLAVGGFNPRFPAPAGFPSLARVSISLTQGKNPRVRLDAYLALTSNTVQLGARAELFLGFASFSVEGHLAFDALFQFSPFRFVTDFSGGVKLKWRSYNLAGIHLKATLSGPAPWHIRGEASFSVWIFDKTVTVDKTFGSEEKPDLPPPVDPVPLLVKALADPRNWSSSLPSTQGTLVTFRQLPVSDAVVIHPLGELAVTQRIVPLNLDLAKFGNTRPRGATRFTLSDVTFDQQTAAKVTPTKEHFAPAEFLEMTDQEKLSRPSFEKMEAGLRVSSEAITFGPAVEQDLNYETIVISSRDRASEEVGEAVLPQPPLASFAGSGAVARSALHRAGDARFRAPARGIAIRPPDFVVVSADDMTVPAGLGTADGRQPVSFTEARAALRRHVETHPGRPSRLQVVPRHLARTP